MVLRTVFELDAQVVNDPVAGTPLVIPIGRRATPDLVLRDDGGGTAGSTEVRPVSGP